MINFNLYVENEYNDWQPNVEDIVEKTKAIFNYYMTLIFCFVMHKKHM